MDLSKNGKLLADLRRAKGMTQKEVADRLGILPKTVSKWETGNGFPDVSYLSELADILGVSERILLAGDLEKNSEEVGNMKRIKFYVCPHCGSIWQGVGDCQLSCCGKVLEPLKAKVADEEHGLKIEEIEDEYYLEFSHEMSKEHYISFVAYVTFDRVLLVRLYPEQADSVRINKMYGGKFYYYCNRDGLFEYQIERKRKKQDKITNEDNTAKVSLTALMSAFARAYHCESEKGSMELIYRDDMARKMFLPGEYEEIERYILQSGYKVGEYVNEQLAPTVLARAKFAEESLRTAVRTGTKQYVILGAGFETYALRNDLPLEIFEVDRKEVIESKLARIAQNGLVSRENVHYIAADLAQDNLGELLEGNGFVKGEKTLFSMMGLLYYLTKDEIAQILEKIALFVAEGSAVVFDIADNQAFSSKVGRVREMIEMARLSGEEMKSCFGYEELEILLQEYGFYVYEFLHEGDIQRRYFADSTKMRAFEHIDYVLAVLKK